MFLRNIAGIHIKSGIPINKNNKSVEVFPAIIEAKSGSPPLKITQEAIAKYPIVNNNINNGTSFFQSTIIFLKKNLILNLYKKKRF